MANSLPKIPSQHETLIYLRLQYDHAIASGAKLPLLFPQVLFGLALMVGFILIDHRNNRFLYQLRWPVWFSIIAIEVFNIRHRISVEPAISYISGVASVYCIVWSTMWLIFERPQLTAKRIERRRKVSQNGTRTTSDYSTQRSPETTEYNMNEKRQNVNAAGLPVTEKSLAEARASNGEWEYYWQSYPDSFGERLAWVIDLTFSLRGRGWNFSIPTNPPLPADVAASLGETVPEPGKPLTSRIGIKCFQTRKELARYVFPRFIIYYLILDLCKFQIIHDPFYRTGNESLPPPAYLEGVSPYFITRIRRNTLLISIITFIQFNALLLPMIASLLLGPRILGIRGEPWMYVTTWGSLSNILDKGIAGFWSGWWHQVFRAGFAAPMNYLIRIGVLSRNSITSNLVGVAMAFIISGAMHATGSFMQVLPTHPERQFIYFMLQIVGVVLQTSFCAALRPWIERLPLWVRRTGNGFFAYVWLYAASPLFMNDMSAGGTWMCEPIMASPLRWLGLGPKGYGWWTWAHVDIGWFQGKHWWESGIGGF